MPRSQFHNRVQLSLKLERQMQALPATSGNPEGLLGALADLLLAALGVKTIMAKGDGDERQDHV